jgi:endonuclease/exonuclease/phosphatase family metal-dependent hydrolase
MKSKHHHVLVFLTIVFILLPVSSHAVKIVTWNILNFPGTDFEERIDDFRLILDEIEPDILVVQQMLSQEGVIKFKNKILNYKSAKPYARAPFFDGPDTDNAVFYKKALLKLISHQQIPTPLRDISEYFFLIKKEPGKNVRFRLYSVHLKAGRSSSDKKKREEEARILRDYLNTLPSDSLFMVCGDFNIYTSTEKAFKILTENEVDNDGRLKDPLEELGNWHDKKKYAELHSQSTRKKKFGGGASGGLDDRFDMFLISYGLVDSYQLAYKIDSYIVYGNDGKHLNKAINDPKNKVVSEEMADALYNVSDHLPVIIELEPPDEFIPRLISPKKGAILDNGCTGGRNEIVWNFKWSELSNATLYQLYVKGDKAWIPIINTYTNKPSYHFQGGGYIIEANRFNWRWKVRALIGGKWYGWSENRRFDVEPLNTDCR